MSENSRDLGRRHLLVLGAAAAVGAPACGGGESSPLGGGGGDAGGDGGSGSSSSGSSSGGSSGSGSSGGSSSSGGGSCTGAKLYSLSFSQYPQLMTVGSSVKVNPPGYTDPTCGQSEIIVIHVSQGNYVALSSSCPHACCSVNLSGSELLCPCHHATFSLTGQTTSSRTSTNLANLPVCADATGVHVTL